MVNFLLTKIIHYPTILNRDLSVYFTKISNFIDNLNISNALYEPTFYFQTFLNLKTEMYI